MPRIVLSTWGSLGDLHPYLAIAVELKRRGHHASVATLSAWKENVLGAGVEFDPVGPEVPADAEAARELVRRILDPADGPRYLFEDVFGPQMRASYEALLAAVRADGGADLLVSHQVPPTGPIVAAATGIRWVSGVLAPLSFLSRYDPPTLPQAPFLRRLAVQYPWVAGGLLAIARRMTSSWLTPLNRLRDELGLPNRGHPLFEGQHSPILVLALFSRAFGAIQPDYPRQTVITGFPFYDARDQRPPSPELLRFLDDGEPPILFTLGSSAVWIAGDFFASSIEAANALGRRALLLAGEDAERLRREGLPDSIAAFEYAPHSLVMPRASVIVHQGGVGTTGQAMRSGRPMLVVPFAQDQPDNARRCVELGVARTIARKAYTTSRVTRELELLLSDPAYARRACQVGAVVQQEKGAVAACDAIERVLRGA
jgi:rhamnosyltransferase subunit B